MADTRNENLIALAKLEARLLHAHRHGAACDCNVEAALVDDPDLTKMLKERFLFQHLAEEVGRLRDDFGRRSFGQDRVLGLKNTPRRLDQLEVGVDEPVGVVVTFDLA